MDDVPDGAAVADTLHAAPAILIIRANSKNETVARDALQAVSTAG